MDTPDRVNGTPQSAESTEPPLTLELLDSDIDQVVQTMNYQARVIFAVVVVQALHGVLHMIARKRNAEG